jgi:uncharacterized protein YjbJ (UPF0337 family)
MNDIDLRTLVARILFKDDYSLRNWEGSKEHLKSKYLERAEKAMKKVQCEDDRMANMNNGR